MKLDAMKLAIATAVVVAVSWIICSLLVLAAPQSMLTMSGHMLHADLGMTGWSFHWTGFFVGLVVWSVLAGLYAGVIAAVYNRLVK